MRCANRIARSVPANINLCIQLSHTYGKKRLWRLRLLCSPGVKWSGGLPPFLRRRRRHLGHSRINYQIGTTFSGIGLTFPWVIIRLSLVDRVVGNAACVTSSVLANIELCIQRSGAYHIWLETVSATSFAVFGLCKMVWWTISFTTSAAETFMNA